MDAAQKDLDRYTVILKSASKKFVKRTLKKRAQDQNYNKQRVRDSFRDVKDDIISQIRDNLRDKSGMIPSNLIASLFEKLEKEDFDKLSEEQVKGKLRQIWEAVKPRYQTIVRTESANQAIKSQLEEWYNAGYEEVIRKEHHDDKVCSKCLALDGNIYRIEDLLKLEYPLTQDPADGSWLTHPNCRGWFVLNVNFRPDDLTSFTPDEFIGTLDFTQSGVDVDNVPVEVEGEVKDTLRNLEIDADVKYVPEITESEEYKKELEDQIRKEKGDISDLVLDSHVEDQMKEDKDKLNSYLTDDGVLLISGNSLVSEPVSLQISRQSASEKWEELSSSAKRKIKKLWDKKRKEKSYTIEEQGVEIFGESAFISPQCEESHKDYFIEAFSYYVTSPDSLYFLDEEIYKILKEEVFGGREFISGGGLA